MREIGFVGLGAMGSVMAPILARAGFQVIGFDTVPQRPELADVVIASSLIDLAACDMVITMLPDGQRLQLSPPHWLPQGFAALLLICHRATQMTQ